ncbi:protein Simiate isoform X2 [Ceratina calcarata]|uniref:Protein Simiate isoform X2 n=1 Tax=Ceratina calcarata TaxID=156304 RepID=A0AAJ7WHI6_9HYME|nr:protein Simiate isoform X2 [Ceratina calcarata]
MPIMNDLNLSNYSDENGEPVDTKRIKSNDNDDFCNAALEAEKNDVENTDLTNNEHDDDEEASLANDERCDDDSLFPFPPDTDVTDMLDGVRYSSSFPTITERYFTPYYKLDVQSPKDDICILMHSNRICMLTLARSHTVFQDNQQITAVDFKVSHKLDRVRNKVSGKSKHGAQPLQTNSNICIITCSDEKTYTIKCCIIGKLVERE